MPDPPTLPPFFFKRERGREGGRAGGREREGEGESE